MPDCFSLLSLPPRAALGEAELEAAYLAATRRVHPDQPGGDSAAAADLNSALETLRSPEKRLRHLMEHHAGQMVWKAVPLDPATMALFEKLGPLLQEAAQLARRRQSASSALAKALLAPQEMPLREALEHLNEAIEQRRAELDAALPGCDARLTNGDSTAWADVQVMQSKFAYLAKWQAQIREALLGLLL